MSGYGLLVSEQLTMFAMFNGLTKNDVNKINELLEIVGLDNSRDKT